MAIQVSTQTVIDNSRKLQNITGADGRYDNFQPSIETIANIIDFNTPMMGLTMSGNVTFSEANKLSGRAAILLLDTSSNSHTPTFSSNVKWPEGIEPTWANYRYWTISFQCVGSIVRAAAVGYESTSSAPSEAVSLLGTAGSPASTFGDLPEVDAFGDSVQESGFRFANDGNIYRRSYSSRANGWIWSFYSLNEWCNVTPQLTYYMRATLQSKVSTGTPDPTRGEALNTWHQLGGINSVRFYSRDTRDFGLYTPSGWTIKVEIATDSAGSNIIETGYYQATWESGA